MNTVTAVKWRGNFVSANAKKPNMEWLLAGGAGWIFRYGLFSTLESRDCRTLLICVAKPLATRGIYELFLPAENTQMAPQHQLFQCPPM